MTDAALFWDEEGFSADLTLSAGDLTTDAGLRTAVVISLFTDRRAEPDDVLPGENADPRGWWGDVQAANDDDRIGSRLWLLSREKQLGSVLVRAEQYATEALAWLVRDGVAKSVEVSAELVAPGVLGLLIIITRPGGPARQRFDFVWRGLS